MLLIANAGIADNNAPVTLLYHSRPPANVHRRQCIWLVEAIQRGASSLAEKAKPSPNSSDMSSAGRSLTSMSH